MGKVKNRSRGTNTVETNMGVVNFSPAVLDDTAIDVYTRGQCFAFAVALTDYFENSRVALICEDTSDSMFYVPGEVPIMEYTGDTSDVDVDEIIHAVCLEEGNGAAYDIVGEELLEAIMDGYNETNDHMCYAITMTAAELRDIVDNPCNGYIFHKQDYETANLMAATWMATEGYSSTDW